MTTSLSNVFNASRNRLAVAFCVVGVLALSCHASADDVRKERVRFAKGTSGATLVDTVKGRDTLEYFVGAASGQHMRAKLNSSSNSIYFNVFAPGKLPGKDEALFIGDTGGDTFDGVLPASGDYMIQVYLYRNAARAGESAKFSLDVSVDAQASSSADTVVPGTNFNATGILGCARDDGQPLDQCKFGVIRQGDGSAELTIFWPDAGSRVVWFERGVPVRYDQSQADGDAKLSFTKNVDLFSVTVGTQRFEIPEAAINGG